jgi:hypothetical protein
MIGAVLRRFLLAAFLLAVSGCSVGPPGVHTKIAPPRVHIVSIYEPEHRRPVRIVVRDTEGPVILALGSAESTTWAVTLEKNVTLREVILQGGPKGPSRVIGTPSDVPVWSEIFGGASEKGDLGYRLAVHYMKERYGGEPISFQIKYSGREFDIR